MSGHEGHVSDKALGEVAGHVFAGQLRLTTSVVKVTLYYRQKALLLHVAL